MEIKSAQLDCIFIIRISHGLVFIQLHGMIPTWQSDTSYRDNTMNVLNENLVWLSVYYLCAEKYVSIISIYGNCILYSFNMFSLFIYNCYEYRLWVLFIPPWIVV